MFRFSWYMVMAITSAFVLVSALFFEHVLLISPCKLCYYQRYLWMGVFATSIMGFLLRETYHRVLMWIISLLLICSVVIATYQTGTIYHWWGEVISCQSNISDFSSLGSLNDLDLQKLSFQPSCSNVDQLIFNVPMPVFNALISLLGVFFIIFHRNLTFFMQKYRKYEK